MGQLPSSGYLLDIENLFLNWYKLVVFFSSRWENAIHDTWYLKFKTSSFRRLFLWGRCSLMSFEEIQGIVIVLKLSENIEPMLFISKKPIAISHFQNKERKMILHVKRNVIQAADHYRFHESISLHCWYMG